MRGSFVLKLCRNRCCETGIGKSTFRRLAISELSINSEIYKLLNSVKPVFRQIKDGRNSLFSYTVIETQKQKTMLDYAKVILPKVSFSRELFQKELSKCIKWVSNSEVEELREWCFENFGENYPDVLTKAFAMKAA